MKIHTAKFRETSTYTEKRLSHNIERWLRHDKDHYADVGVAWVWDREAQPKSCLTSLVGGVSAGCLGSTSRLEQTMSKRRRYIEIRTYLLRYRSCRSPPCLDCSRACVRYSWTSGISLRVYGTWKRCISKAKKKTTLTNNSRRKSLKSRTLNNPRKFMMLIKVEKLLIRISRRITMWRITLTTEGDIG